MPPPTVTLPHASLEASLTPAGRISIGGPQSAATDALAKAFERDSGAGLIELALGDSQDLAPSLAFWRRLAAEFLGAACAALDPTAPAEPVRPAPPAGLFESLTAAVPPMLGAELVSPELFGQLWSAMTAALAELAAPFAKGLAEFLESRGSDWHTAGRICLHLAENKRSPERPFAFIATYARRIAGQDELQYVPLGHALREYHGAGETERLLALLTPLKRAAADCTWLDELVRTGDIYHPLGWTADDAYRLLSDTEALEAAGLVVRVPDWWKQRSLSRPTVSVTVGDETPAGLGIKAMLDFQIAVTLGGERLSSEELAEILSRTSGLALIRGSWVEVDSERLSSVLDQWLDIRAVAEDGGLGFAEAMRLLSGTDAQLGGDEDWAETRAWSEVHPGQWLASELNGLKAPALLDAIDRNAGLDAQLRPYQKHGVQWLRTLFGLGLGGCLADDMGLGKTIQVIGLLSLLKEEGAEPGLDLLIVPASLIANWTEELKRFAPHLRPLVAHASALPRRELVALDEQTLELHELVITTYGTALRTPWIAERAWRAVVLDEAQAIKNPSAKQTRAILKLDARWRLALTGTPVENRLGDLWSIFNFLNPGLLGSAKAFGRFTRQCAGATSEGRDGYAPLRKLVEPYILRRLKTDKRVITDLPDKTEVTTHCLLSKEQAALYREAVRELEAALREAEDQEAIQRRGIVLSFLMRFKQLCNHPAQWLGTPDFAAARSGKFQRLAELAEEVAARQEKLLIFTQFRSLTRGLAAHLADSFGRPGLVLHGGTRIKRRQEMVHEFQAPEGPPFMVLSLKAGGTGLNLTAANHVVHFDRWWNPAVENQATDRAFRIGQKRNVMVHKFVCQGTIEERIDAMIAAKRELAGSVLSSGAEASLTELSNEELLDMVRLDLGSATAS